MDKQTSGFTLDFEKVPVSYNWKTVLTFSLFWGKTFSKLGKIRPFLNWQ